MVDLKLSDLDKQFVATTDQYELYIADNSKGEPIVFTVGRTGRTEHEVVARRYSKQLERARRSPERYRKVMIEIVAKSILLDWVGLIEDGGKAIPCSFENRVQVLTKYDEIFSLVLECAADASLFREDDEEELTEKN